MTAFWKATPIKLSSPLPPAEVERRLRAALADRKRRPRLSGNVHDGRVVLYVRPLDYRSDMHPRLRARIAASGEGSTLQGRIAILRWVLAMAAGLVALFAGVALLLLAVTLGHGANSRAREPQVGFVAASLATVGVSGHIALLLWFARRDRTVLAEFLSQTLEGPAGQR